MGFISELLFESILDGTLGITAPTGNSKVLRNSMTKEVRRLWRDFLQSFPVCFQHPGVIDDYLVDFHCQDERLVIEIDRAKQASPTEMEKCKKRADAFRTKNLTILRIPLEDINHNFNGVCKRIDQCVKQCMQKDS